MGAKNTLVGQVVCDSAGRWDNAQASGIAADWVTWYTEYTPKKAGSKSPCLSRWWQAWEEKST